MNITLNKTDEVSATITIEVVKADYEDKVDHSLKDLRRTTVIPGFRKGMAPPSFLRQKYGKAILAEEINKLISNSLTDYIKENAPDILGEPLPAEGQTPIDFDAVEDFSYTFDVGLSPEIDIQLTKDDKIPYYQLQVTDELIDNQIKSYQDKFGKQITAEEAEEKDIVKGLIVELNENGEPKENGIIKEGATLMPLYLKNEEEKIKFIGVKSQSTVIFNPQRAYDGSEAELASFLTIKKEDVGRYTGDFSFEIKEILRYQPAEINQELFDKVFGAGAVDGEELFREKVKAYLTQQFSSESDYKFHLDVWKLIEEKTSVLQLPDAFLKRWLLHSDAKKTPESLEEEYPRIAKGFRLQLVREKLIEDNDIHIEESDLQEYARQATRIQFAQYGIDNLPDDILEKYSQEMLQKKDTYRSLGDKLFEDRLMMILKEQITLEPQEVTLEDFNKMFENN